MQENQTETEQQKAERLIREHEAQLLQQRKELGKRRKLYQVSIHYELDREQKTHYIPNRTWEETLVIRERMFKAGLAVEYDPGTLLILPPHELKAIFITNQERYFEP